MRWSLILLLLLPGLAAAQPAEENPDRGILQAFIEDNLSDSGRTVRIDGFKGALSSRASFETLTIADETGVWLSVRDAVLEWSRTALLDGELRINELSAGEIVLARVPEAGPPAAPTAESQPFVLPDLPVVVDIAKLAVGKLTLGAEVLGEAAEFTLTGGMRLDAGDGSASLSLARTDGPEAALSLAGAFSNATRELTISLSVSEGAEGLVGRLIALPGTPAFALTLEGAGPLEDFSAELALATEGEPRVTGNFRMTDRADPGETGAMIRSFTAQLGGDLRPLVAPAYHPFLGPGIALVLSGDRFPDGRTEVSEFELSADAIRVTGSFATDPTGWPLRAKLSGQVSPPAGETVTLLLPGAPTDLARGSVDLSYDAARGSAWVLSSSFEGFSRPDMSISRLALDGRGTVDLAGQRIAGRLAVDAAGLTPADSTLAQALGSKLALSTDFAWSPGAPLEISGLDLKAEDYGLTGDLTIAGADGGIDLTLRGDIAIAAQDFGRFGPLAGAPLAGNGELNLAGSFQPISGAFDAQIAGRTTDLATGQTQLDPLLAGEVRLDISAARGSFGLRLPRLSAQSDAVSVNASGSLATGSADLTFDVAVGDVSVSFPGVSGPARLRGHAIQKGDVWTAQVAASGPGSAEAALDGTATLQDSGIGEIAGTFDATVGDLAVYRTLTGRRLGGSLAVNLAGTGDWRARTGTLRLAGSSQDLAIGMAEADAALRGAGTYEVALSREDGGRIRIDALDLLTPAAHVVTAGEIATDQGALEFSADVTDIGRFVEGFSGPARVDGSAKRDQGDWAVMANLGAAGGAAAAVEGTLAPDISTADLGIKGIIPLGFINRFITPNRTEGTASFDLRLAGPLSLTSLGGLARIEGARIVLPTLKQGFEDISGTARLAGGQAQIDLAARGTEGGRLTMTGTAGIIAPYAADFAIDLDTLRVREPGLYTTDVSGRATVVGPLTGAAQIGGDFTLGQTEVRISEIPAASAGTVEGLTHLGEPAPSVATRQRAGLVSSADGGPATAYPLDISVIAPNRIFVRGRGLDAELGGRLSLGGTTANVITDGRFTLVRGRLDLLGKRLVLDEASIRLQGDFNPFIRAVAVTQSGETEITVILEGPATAPVVTFTSAPSLPQDEIVALLLFDKGIAEISALQALRIASALRTLAGKGGGLTDTLRSKTGLDDLDITTSAEGQTEITAGKYINENIYSDVTVDAQGQSTINLNLSLTPNVTTRGTLNSDGTSALGLFFERDY